MIESDVYEATEDLVISYLDMTQHEINDQWILEQNSVEIHSTTYEKPQQMLSEQWIQDKMTQSQKLAYAKKDKEEKPVEELVPKVFHDYIPTIFSKQPIGKLPT